MTAGRGIAHSEVSLPQTTTLHGAQLWVALPDSERHREPFFESYIPEPITVGDATLRVFLGSLAGSTSTARVFTELLGAQVNVPAGASVTLAVDERFELGVLLDAGEVAVNGVDVPLNHLAYVPPGSNELTLTATADARLLLIGGVPLGEQIVMWWNFIGRTHEEIVEYREDWESGRRFAPVTGYDGSALHAPVIPPIRLRPRG
jgi:redox-sensitive bicupin YhaK (pirin superfamily)